jgi:hypothetical protein
MSLMEDAVIDIKKAEELHPNGDIGMIYLLVARWVGLLLEGHAMDLLSEILALDADVISMLEHDLFGYFLVPYITALKQIMTENAPAFDLSDADPKRMSDKQMKSLLATYGQVVAITGHSVGLNKWNDCVTVAKVSLEGMKPVDFANQFEQMGRYIHHTKMIGLGNPSDNSRSAQSDGMPTDPSSFIAFLDPQYQKSSTKLYVVAKASVCDFNNKVNVDQASQALLGWGFGNGKNMQHYDTLHIMYKHYQDGIESAQPWNVREQSFKFALSENFDLTGVLGAGRLVDAPVGQPKMTITKALAQQNVGAALSWSRGQFEFQQPSLADMEYLIPDFYD